MNTLPPDLCGNAMLGTDVPSVGRVRNLSARQDGYDGAHMKFAYEGDQPDDNRLAVAIDGSVQDLLDCSQGDAAAGNLADGPHVAHIVPVQRFEDIPDLHGDFAGLRAYVEWPRSPDSNCESYNVKQDGATITTISETEIERRIYATPDTGTGRGRISSTGATGKKLNVGMLLTIASAGVLSYSCNGSSGSHTFGAGETIQLPYGVIVTMHDAPEDYVDGDAWTVWIGPRNYYLTNALSDGTYIFTVTAIGSGNESTPLTVRKVKVTSPPPELSGVTLAWDTDTLTVSWIVPIGPTGVRIYSNYDKQFGVFEDYVIEEFPHDTVNSPTHAWTFTTSAVGTLRFYLRTYTETDQSESISLYEFSFPPSPADIGLVLGIPTRFTATPAAAGKIAATWDYSILDGDDLDHFAVCIAATEAAFDWDNPTDTVAVTAGTAELIASRLLSFAFTSVAAYGAAQYIAVRAVAADGTLGTAATAIQVTPVATAPEFTGDTIAVQQ